MSIPIEYIVIGGFLGLGEFILLEVIFEIIYNEDVKNFIGICKMTYKLK